VVVYISDAGIALQQKVEFCIPSQMACTPALHPIRTSYRNAIEGDFLRIVTAHAWMQHSMQQFANMHICPNYLYHALSKAGLSNTVECCFYRL